jgi:hypothetical protein
MVLNKSKKPGRWKYDRVIVERDDTLDVDGLEMDVVARTAETDSLVLNGSAEWRAVKKSG